MIRLVKKNNLLIFILWYIDDIIPALILGLGADSVE